MQILKWINEIKIPKISYIIHRFVWKLREGYKMISILIVDDLPERILCVINH